MKKIYEVRINTVDPYYWGRPNGHKHVGYTLDATKAEELRKITVNEILATRKDWWMDIGKNANGEPDVEVVELGEVWE